jgi:hypothetical protein
VKVRGEETGQLLRALFDRIAWEEAPSRREEPDLLQ